MNGPDSLTDSPQSTDGLKPYACILCVQRKVKCDKRYPCNACTKSHLQCAYRTGLSAPRKRKADFYDALVREKIRSQDPVSRNGGIPLRGIEEAIRIGNGQSDIVEEITVPLIQSTLSSGVMQNNPPSANTRLPHRGILVPEHGGRRYYEHGFIGILGQQYRQDPKTYNSHDAVTEARQASSEELATTVLTGLPSPTANFRYRQLPAADVTKYWQTFLANVHPLTKIIHAPTDYQIMTESHSGHTMSTDALRYAICAVTVASLSEKSCQDIIGEHQASLLYEFQSATRYKLLEASFLRVPDSSLLRAEVLLLTSMLQTSESSSLWILMGSAMRMAQSQGLHRDGQVFGLTPFETEMRRRLWWYLVILDGRLTELTGSESTLPKFMDTQLPSNINDTDLDPAMKSPAQPRKGACEMTFCLVQYEAARFLAENDPRYDESERHPPSTRGDHRTVTALECYLEEKFLRFCDPVVPVHFLTTLLARSNLCKFRQMEHRRIYRTDPPANDDEPSLNPLKDNNTTLNVAVRNIEYDNLIHSSPSLRGFLWHVNFHFPWGAPIFILKDLAFHPDWDEEMKTAWTRIEELHKHHPEFQERGRIQNLIVGGLTVKAWAARETWLQARGGRKLDCPGFILGLQNQQAPFVTKQQTNQNVLATGNVDDNEVNYAAVNGVDFTEFDLMDPMFADVDWFGWSGY